MSKNTDISDPRFGARVKALRKQRNLTRYQLADEADTTYRTILAIEKNQRKRSQEGTLMRIAAVLGVPLDRLLDLDTPLPFERDHASPATGDAPAEVPEAREDSEVPPPARSRRGVWIAAAIATVVVAGALVAVPGIQRISSIIVGPPIGEPPPPPISQVTTDSDCAYSDFVEGWQHLQKLQRDEAREDFRAAIGCDSTFAMAYLMLVHPYMSPSADERRALIAKAIHYSGHASERERLHIHAMKARIDDDAGKAIRIYEQLVDRYPKDVMALRQLAQLYQSVGRAPEAIATYELAVRLYPEDGMTLNRLAYAQFTEGNYTRALECADRYIEAEPKLANPYDTRGDILAWSGHWKESIGSYREALARDPDFFPSRQSLALMHLLSGNIAEAQRNLERLARAKDAGYRARARFLLAAVPIFEGRFDEARERLVEAIAADRADEAAWHEDGPPWKEMALANLCEATGDARGAVVWGDSLAAWMAQSEPGRLYDWYADIVRLDALTDTTAAVAALDSLDARAAPDDPRRWEARGWMEMARGHAGKARIDFGRANTRVRGFAVRYSLALACLETGRPAEAAHQLENTLRRPTADQVLYAPWRVLAHYHLARAYETLGKRDDAATQYRQFLRWWPDVPMKEVADARRRLDSLESAPTARVAAAMEHTGPYQVHWTAGHIWVRDLGTNSLAWSFDYKGNKVEETERVTWNGRDYVAYGLGEDGPDIGALIVRDVATGKLRWRQDPDVEEPLRVFGPEYAGERTFTCNHVESADIDGDGTDEIVAEFTHRKWYPAYLCIYRADGSVVGRYFNRGAIDGIVGADIDGDGKDELIVGGTNNTPAYQGATVFVLDDTHCSGAAVDSLCTLGPGLADSSLVRVVFPAFEKRYMDLFGDPRLRARRIGIYRTPKGEARIQVSISTDAFAVVILDLDPALDVVSWGIADELHENVHDWTPQERYEFEHGYIPEWLKRVYRYGAHPSIAAR